MMWRALLLVMGVNCIVSGNPIISPAFSDVLENSSLELTCYTNEHVTVTQWGSLNHMGSFSHLYLSDNGSCKPDGFIADNRYFETSCYSNGTFKINIKHVNLSNHGQEWYCYDEKRKSNIANITVRVQPRKVRFNFGIVAEERLIVNQNEEVTFQCFAESYPLPDIVIKNQRDEEIIMMKNTSSVQHIIHRVSCADAGEYVCSARNMLTNGQGALSKLVLIVRCPPRPSADTLRETKMHFDVTLQYLAKEFLDEQNKTVFAWYKQNVPLQNDGNKYIISSHGLQSNLIIRNITQSDYGQYRVVVRNSFGNYTHYYEVREKAQQSSTEHITASALLRVAISISIFTFIVVVLEFSYWRCIRLKQILKIKDRKTADVVTEYQTTTGDNDNAADNGYEEIDEQCKAREAYMDMQGIKTDNNSNCEYIDMKIQTLSIGNNYG